MDNSILDLGIGLAFFFLGLLMGSFANVVIHRLPLKESVVHPRSRCPNCRKQIAWYDNIPLVSWILLKGKCRNCSQKISWRYPLVEFLMASLFCGLFFKIGLSWTLIELVILTFGLVVVTFIDFDHMILPDVFTLSGIIIGLVGGLLNPERGFWGALGGVILGGGFLWSIAYIYFAIRKEEGMGGGDIKLLAWIGAVLGWQSVPFVILASSIIGSLVGIILAMKKVAGLKTTIPFGPYLALAALLYVFGGNEIGLWYVNLFIPLAGR